MRTRGRAFVGATLMAAAVTTAVVGASGDTGSTFHIATVDALNTVAEPSVALDGRFSPPRLYVYGPELYARRLRLNGGPMVYEQAASRLYRSDDGGRSFREMASPRGGGGDSTLAVDGDGTIYTVEVGSSSDGSFPISVSTDGGETFRRTATLLEAGHVCDRPWIVAWGHGNVAVTGLSLELGLLSWVSSDGGVTFDGPFVVASSASKPGALIRTSGGALYQTWRATYLYEDWLYVGKSADGGRTWTVRRALQPTSDLAVFPSMAADDAGHVYLAWAGTPITATRSTGVPTDGSDLWFASSSDDGATWRPARRLSPANRTAVLAWIVIRPDAEADVLFVEADSRVTPESAPPTTQWSLRLLRSANPSAAAPAWSRTTIHEGFHAGSICAGGGIASVCGMYAVGVPHLNDSRFLDYFGMTSDANGDLYVAYAADNPISVRDDRNQLRLATTNAR
jgi:hypothetical protein